LGCENGFYLAAACSRGANPNSIFCPQDSPHIAIHISENYARLKAAATQAKSPVTLGGTMALTFSIVDTWEDGKRVHVSGTVVASGNYTTSGDTLDLSQVPLIASDQPPVQGTAWMD
jgi:hypothetical protein